MRGVAFLGGPLMSAEDAGRVGGGGGIAPVDGADGLPLCGDTVCALEGGGGGAAAFGASSPA